MSISCKQKVTASYKNCFQLHQRNRIDFSLSRASICVPQAVKTFVHKFPFDEVYGLVCFQKFKLHYCNLLHNHLRTSSYNFLKTNATRRRRSPIKFQKAKCETLVVMLQMWLMSFMRFIGVLQDQGNIPNGNSYL